MTNERQTLEAAAWQQAPYQSALLLNETAALPRDTAMSSPAAPLSAQTKLSLSIVGVALCVGVSGNALLRATPWGVNLPLWLGLSAGVVGLWQRRVGKVVDAGATGLVALLFVFAAGFAWRDSAVLRGLDLFALLVLFALIGLRSRTGRLVTADVSEYFAAALHTVWGALAGPFLLFLSEIGWRELPREGWQRRAPAILRGLLLAAPLLLVFGLLLVAADAAFEDLIRKLFSLDFASLFLHGLTIGAIAWLASGYLRSLQPHSARVSAATNTQGLSLGIVEIGTVLGLLDLLFLVFVLVQFQYLFFGATHFKPGAGTPYAMYARRGFFELVTVATLVLPLLLGAHWLLRKDEPRAERVFRWLAGLQIGLLFVMMASAMYRMRLYQLCCGLTELRVYTMAFMIWLALVFIWFAMTVLRGRRDRFAFGAVVARWALIVGLHLLNPDALIARVNVQRALAGLPFDAYYTSSLSADSIPALVEGLPLLKAEDQRIVRQRLQARQTEFVYTGWRSWNWARMRADQRLQTLFTQGVVR